MTTCLVTGGAGFIGCAISAELTRRFERVTAIDNLHPQVHAQRIRPAALHEGVELIVADVTLSETWDALLEDIRPEVVIHLAAETGTGQSLTEASRHASVNVLGTARMLDAFASRSLVPKKFVLASSRAVYGEGAWQEKSSGKTVYPGQRSRRQLESGQWDFPGLTPLPSCARSTETRPTNIYGATKLAQENMLRAWATSFGSSLSILRLQNVYGPGQSVINSYTGIVTLFARLARAGESIPVYEDGQIVRDFVFIDDVAAAICRATGDSADPAAVYDIGSGRADTILGLATVIADFYKAPPPHINGAFRHGDVRHACCDMSRSPPDLGWTPRWTFEAGIERVCHWMETTDGV